MAVFSPKKHAKSALSCSILSSKSCCRAYYFEPHFVVAVVAAAVAVAAPLFAFAFLRAVEAHHRVQFLSQTFYWEQLALEFAVAVFGKPVAQEGDHAVTILAVVLHFVAVHFVEPKVVALHFVAALV